MIRGRMRRGAMLAALAALAVPAEALAGDDDSSPVRVRVQALESGPVPQGEPFAYRLTLFNPGPEPSGEIVATHALRELATGESVDGATSTHSLDPGERERLRTEIAPGQWFAERGRFRLRIRTTVGKEAGKTFRIGAAELPVPLFRDVTERAGLDSTHQIGSTCNGTQTAGAAWADVEGDGDLDLFVPDQHVVSKLWIQRRPGNFVDRAAPRGVAAAGEGYGASFADYDDDGDQDLFVAANGPDRLYRNNGAGSFTDVAPAAGIADPGTSTSGSWGDFDRDGNLDLYVSRWGGCDTGDYPSDSLYRNQGDGTFADVTGLLAPGPVDGRGFLGGWADLDVDRDLDLYLANDFVVFDPSDPPPKPNGLWRNESTPGNPQLTDVSAATGADLAINSMGIGFGDPDGDLDLDIAISNMGATKLLANRRHHGDFEEIGAEVGVARPEQEAGVMTITWGLAFSDLNNDGAEDLYVGSGEMAVSNPYPMANALFVNRGDGSFVDLSAPSGADDRGDTRGVALADYDRDGRTDLYVVNRGGEPRLLRNITRDAGHWLEVDVEGTQGDRDACGATLYATAGGSKQMRQVLCGSTSLGSGSDTTVHFGLGEATEVERLRVIWPSGAARTLRDVPADGLIEVSEPGP